MKLKVETKRNVLVVRTGTDKLVDMRLLGEIRGLPAKYPGKKWKGLVIDLASVDFINSTAISAILGCSKDVTHDKKGFVICGLKKRVLELFEISRLSKLIAIREGIEESVDLVQHWHGRSMEQILKDNLQSHFDDNKTREAYIAREARHVYPTPPAREKAPEERKMNAPEISNEPMESETPVEPGGEWNKVTVARPGVGDTQEIRKKFNIQEEEDPMAHRLNPLFDALRQLRKVAKAEGLDVDLNSTIGQIVAQFVNAVRNSEEPSSDEENDES